jgi:hypothetical protein
LFLICSRFVISSSPAKDRAEGAKVVDTLPRPVVSPERYRELEVLAMQIMVQIPHQNLDECLIVRDLCENILRRWIENERMAQHEIAARKGVAILAEEGGNIIHLPRGGS